MDIFNLLNKYNIKLSPEKSAAFKKDFKSSFLSKTEFDSSVADLKTKFESETNALKDEFAKKEYVFLASRLIDSYEFSCPLAKEASLAKIINADLPVENGELKGGPEFIDSIKKENPAAFSSSPIELSITGSTDGKSGRLFSKASLRSAFGLPL